LNRRQLLLASAATLAARTASAQAWPTRPLRFVVPFAAGAGILDIMARIVGQHLGEATGQQVVVDNRPGAGGNVGADIVVKAAPDGYTMLMGNTAALVAPYLIAHMNFDPLTDLVPVTQVNSAPLMLVVHPSLPVTSVKEFIAYAQEKKGALNYGSGGVGATPFLAVELFKAMANFDAVHVPYKGGAPALADLMAGQISFMIENVPGTLPYVKDGKLRALAITSATRNAELPDVPTMAESGLPEVSSDTYYGLFGPGGMPDDAIRRINAAVNESLKAPELRAAIARIGFEPSAGTPEDFTAILKKEMTVWIPIVKKTGFQLN
jgi:tripartite-type tricarboxylate transporter receptor subunit TctC